MSVPFDKVSKGKEAEAEAVKFLKGRGYRIMERNYRCPFGEVDLVAKDGDTIVFVEVKSNSTSDFGPPKGRVDSRKQRRIIRSSLHYLTRHRLTDLHVRFDVVSIEFRDGSVTTELVKDAFEASG